MLDDDMRGFDDLWKSAAILALVGAGNLPITQSAQKSTCLAFSNFPLQSPVQQIRD